MSRLSIIVPSFGAPLSAFEDTIASVLRNIPDDTQIVVVDDGRYPNEHNIESLGVEFVRVKKRGNRGIAFTAEAFEFAVQHCQSDVVHLLRPGVIVDDGWADQAVALMAETDATCVTPFIVDERRPDRIVTAGITSGFGYQPRLVGTSNRLDSRKANQLQPLGPSSWAAFYRRDAVLSICRDSDLVEHCFDLDLALCFRQLGLKNVCASDSVVSIEQPSWIARSYQFVSGAQLQRMLWRHDPSTIGSVMKTVATGLSELVAGVIQPRKFRTSLGRFAALSHVFSRTKQRNRLLSAVPARSEPAQALKLPVNVNQTDHRSSKKRAA